MKQVLVVFIILYSYAIGLAQVRFDNRIPTIIYAPIDLHNHTDLSSIEPGRKKYGPDHTLAPTIENLGQRAHVHNAVHCQLDHGALMSLIRWQYSADWVRYWERKGVITFRGFEWTKGMIWDRDVCHIGVINTDWFCDPQSFGDRQKELTQEIAINPKWKRIKGNKSPDIIPNLESLYVWLDRNLGSQGFWGFAHPWQGKYQFDDFQLAPQRKVRERCCYIEIAGGAKPERVEEGLTFAYRAIQKGWCVGFGFGYDNPGEVKYTRTSIWSGAILDRAKSRQSIIDAIFTRRLFVSEVVGFYFDWRLESKLGRTVSMGGRYDTVKLGAVEMYRFYVPIDRKSSIKTMFLYFVYPDRIEKFYPNDKNGYMEPVEQLNRDYPIAVICGMITNDKKWIVGSPIWID